MSAKLKYLPHPNHKLIVEACSVLIKQMNDDCRYEQNDMMRLASLISYGMHRPLVWQYRCADHCGLLTINTITQQEITQQLNIVFSGLRVAHIMLSNKINPTVLDEVTKSKTINAILKDLLYKMSAVMLQKSLYQTRCHKEATREKLGRIALDLERNQLLESTLERIYAIELDDQRKVFPALLAKYNKFINAYEPNRIRDISIKSEKDKLLMEGGVTCSSLLKFKPFIFTGTQVPHYFRDFLHLKPPFVSRMILVKKVAKHGCSVEPHLRRQYSSRMETSPTSVADLSSHASIGYYSLFGKKTPFDHAMDQHRESFGAQSPL